MRILNLISVTIICLLSCKKESYTPQKEETKPPTIINILYNSTIAYDSDSIEIICQSKDTTYIIDSTSFKVKPGTYKIYSSSIPKKMTWDNRGKGYCTWQTDTFEITISEGKREGVELNRKATAKEIKEITPLTTGSVSGMVIDCDGKLRDIGLMFYIGISPSGLYKNFVTYVPFCD